MANTLERLRAQQRITMGAIRSRVVDVAAHAAARVRYMMPDAHPSRFGIRVVEDVSYGPHATNKLDVYIPTRVPKPLPVVMYVHGGGFAMLSKETHRVMALSIARRGYLTFNIDYRQGTKNQFPAPLEDASTALLWVARHAVNYGGDPTQLAIAGESAGGNLVTALALIHSMKRPEPFARRLFDAHLPLCAVIATYPFLDVHDVHRWQDHPTMPTWVKDMLFDAATSYVGSRVFGPRDDDALHSPLVLLERAPKIERPLPPFFLSVGTRDPLLAHSRRLKDALDRMGTECILHISPGEIHGFDAMVWREPAKDKWRAAHEFLASHMHPNATPKKAG